MSVPAPLKILVLIVATTAFYTMVGQLVPQKEVHPPKETELKKDMTADDLVKAGKEIAEGKGLCSTCHTVGRSGALRFPRPRRHRRARGLAPSGPLRRRLPHGGQLRMDLEDGSQLEVLPAGGTLVCFLSHRFAHEVLPATRSRLSLTGWFRRRA